MENSITIDGIKHTFVKDTGSLLNCTSCSLDFCKNDPSKTICCDVFNDSQGHFKLIEK